MVIHHALRMTDRVELCSAFRDLNRRMEVSDGRDTIPDAGG